jgi:hypothetical protein
MATYGAKALTRIAVASQTAFGTAATFGTANGEVLFNETIGSLDLGVTIDLGETTSVGKRTAIQSSQPTITGKAPVLTIAESPASLRTLPILFQSIGGTVSGTAPSTWTWTPTQGDVDTLDFLTFLATDGVQQYTIRDAVPTEITISADANGLLQAGATLAATVVSSSSATYPNTLNTNPLMPGRLMKLSIDTDFPDKTGTGATDFASIYSFNLSIQTGAGMITALDGTITAATAALTGVLDATLTFTAASNSAATTSFPITSIGSQKFLRLYGSLSGTPAYGIWILGSWVVENVVPLSADQDGVVVNEVTCRLAFDSSVAAGAGKSIQVIIDSPLAAIPAGV